MIFCKIERLIVFFFLCSITRGSFSQGFSPYYTNTTYQKYLNYLVNSGRLKVKHQLSQPYSVGELSDSLKIDGFLFSSTIPHHSSLILQDSSGLKPHSSRSRSWSSLLLSDLSMRHPPASQQDSTKGNLTIGVEPGNRNISNKKINANDFFGSGFASYTWRNIGFYSSVTIDEAYKRDSLYFGSTGKLENKVFSRSNESYLQWENKNFVLFAGRINRNYGLVGENSLILSGEAFSFDHLAFTFRNSFLKYTGILGRLNDIYGYDIRDTVSNYQWSKRFLTIHRFEVSLSEKVEFAFTDVILFGGKDASPQFQYLNPVSFLFMSKMSDRKGYEETNANALMCFDIYFKPTNNLTLYSQFLIDDMDFTKSLRAVFPDRVGYTTKAIYTDLFPESQFSLSYNKTSNWTYNSFYTWGNYTYYGKSIGCPRNGTENIKLGFESFNFFPFMLGFEIMAEQYRSQVLDAPFIGVKTDFPIGIPEKTVSMKLNTTFIPNSFISVNFSTEFVSYNNYGFVESQKRTFLNVFLSIKMQGIFRVF